jgi:tRNA-specific 2-thiouridylase
MKESKGKVLVAMSGGVDSSVAAALLVDEGYEVIGATMQVWDYSNCTVEEGLGTCCSSQDVDDARSVADTLGIPFYVLNCEEKFKEAVIDPFVQAYLQGETPLPCVNCNTFLKFDHLIRKMQELECDFLATGHYAQVRQGALGAEIHTSEDSWKDQTYFLFTLKKEILPKLLFPVGHLQKPQVRKIAEEKNLMVHRKKDSTGICFVGDRGYGEFVKDYVGTRALEQKKGFFRRFPEGEIVGAHAGIHLFTYGQSRGLGLDHHEKLFVVKIDSDTNTVWLGEEKHIYKDRLQLRDSHWLSDLQRGEKVRVKVRYQHSGALARVERLHDGGVEVIFDEPQRAITPGQAAVFYREKQLLGGGWIL